MTVKYRMRRVAIDDTPQDGKTNRGVSSNWAYDRAVLDAAHAALFGLHTKVVGKTADEIVNNSTTLQNDDELFFAVAANEIWYIHVVMIEISSAVADFKYGFTAPAGASFDYAIMNAAPANTRGLSDTYGDAGAGLAARAIVLPRGLLVVGATAGNFQLQWAQNTAEVSDTTVKVGSCIIAHKIA